MELLSNSNMYTTHNTTQLRASRCVNQQPGQAQRSFAPWPRLCDNLDRFISVRKLHTIAKHSRSCCS